MIGVVRFITELIRETRRDRQAQAERMREAEAWDRAGRPTGPGCDQSWRDQL